VLLCWTAHEEDPKGAKENRPQSVDISLFVFQVRASVCLSMYVRMYVCVERRGEKEERAAGICFAVCVDHRGNRLAQHNHSHEAVS